MDKKVLKKGDCSYVVTLTIGRQKFYYATANGDEWWSLEVHLAKRWLYKKDAEEYANKKLTRCTRFRIEKL